MESEEKQKEKARNISIAEGAAYSVMDGFGYRYLTPFALAIGANSAHIGILSSLPSLLGSISQSFSLKLIEKYSRKKIVIASVLLQSLMWLPLIALGFAYFYFNLQGIAPIILIGIYTLMIIFGGFAGPAWHSWMKDLTEDHTESYFGKRNVIVGSVAMLCMFIGASILDNKTGMIGFAIVFIIAFCGRVISVFLFKKQYEPKIELKDGYYFSFLDFIKKMRSNNFGNYVLFAGIITFATAIASPFFAVYMLKDLDFSYPLYMLITLSSVIFSLIFMPIWGKIGDNYGNVKILRICGSLIFLVPLLWFASAFLFPSNSLGLIIFLVITEIFSGIVWGGFGLSSSTFVFHAASRERVALCFTYSGIINAVGAFIGALLGGFLASINSPIFGLKAILFVFLLSAILRVVFFFTFAFRFKEVREVKNFNINIRHVFTSLSPGQLYGGIKRITLGHH